MALSNEILNDFFNKPQKQSSPIHSPQKSTVSHFKVFDDPTKIPNTNLGQTEDKHRTNIRQTKDEVKAKIKTSLGQEKKQELTDSTCKTKLKTQPKTNHKTKSGQTEDEVKTNQVFFSLVGLQKKIVLLIYELCKKALNKMTPQLSIEYIATSCETTKSSAQKTIQRLEDKEAIIRANYKNGRGGWTQYELPKTVYNDILHSDLTFELRTNIGQSHDKYKTEHRTEHKTHPSSSSSSFKDLKETTTTSSETFTQSKIDLSEEWLDINIEPLAFIGFSINHLVEIANETPLTPEQVQHSIYAYSFDLRYNQVAKGIRTTPIHYFKKPLIQGIIYNPPKNYETPQEESVKIFNEKKKEIAARELIQEREMIESLSNEWYESFSPEAFKKQYLDVASENQDFPMHLIKQHSKEDPVIRAEFKKYYEQYLWPEKKKEMRTFVGGKLTAPVEE